MSTLRTTQSGMTLLEMAISSSILGVLILSSLTFTTSMTDSASVEMRLSKLRDSAQKAVDRMSDDLSGSFIPDDTNWRIYNGEDNYCRFLVPVDPDGDGDVNDDDMATEWGVARPEGEFLDRSHIETGSMRQFYQGYMFTMTDYFYESDKDFDLNGDGDKDDFFDIGHITKYYSWGQDPQQGDLDYREDAITPDTVVVQYEYDPETGSNWGDIDGDGESDPLFKQKGSRIDLTLFMIDTDGDEPLLIKVQTSAAQRNM